MKNNILLSTIGMFFGFVTGVFLMIVSESITLNLYKLVGINKPICLDMYSCAINALFNCSLYLLGILGVCCLAYSLGLLFKITSGESTNNKLEYGK